MPPGQAKGKILVNSYIRQTGQTAGGDIFCLDLQTGQVLWQAQTPSFVSGYGITKDGHLRTFSNVFRNQQRSGAVMDFDPLSGKILRKKDVPYQIHAYSTDMGAAFGYDYAMGQGPKTWPVKIDLESLKETRMTQEPKAQRGGRFAIPNNEVLLHGWYELTTRPQTKTAVGATFGDFSKPSTIINNKGAKRELPAYSDLVRTGDYLVVISPEKTLPMKSPQDRAPEDPGGLTARRRIPTRFAQRVTVFDAKNLETIRTFVVKAPRADISAFAAVVADDHIALSYQRAYWPEKKSHFVIARASLKSDEPISFQEVAFKPGIDRFTFEYELDLLGVALGRTPLDQAILSLKSTHFEVKAGGFRETSPDGRYLYAIVGDNAPGKGPASYSFVVQDTVEDKVVFEQRLGEAQVNRPMVTRLEDGSAIVVDDSRVMRFVLNR